VIYLIFKMFVYLILAGGIGGAAGWLLRNLQAQQSEEKARRAVTDAKSKVPQVESLLRGRDEQVTKLKEEVRERRIENKALAEEIKAGEKKANELQREANRWRQSAETKKEFSIDDRSDEESEHGADELIAELSGEITLLKEQLAEGEHAAPHSQAYQERYELVSAELDASRLQTSQMEKAMDTAQTDLKRNQQTLSVLERERELQNKSLKVLHQQLDLERSNQLASG
jgi:hypothetical protein